MIRCLSILAVMCATSCAVDGEIGDDAIGIWIENECGDAVQANAADSAVGAVDRLNSEPITIRPGEGRTIDVIANVAAEPRAYFVAIGVDAHDPVVREFDIERLREELVRATFAGDCATLVEEDHDG